MTLPTTIHFWNIHKKVAKRALKFLSQREHDVIAADSSHETPEFRHFNSYVNTVTLKIYEDPDHFLNDPSSFRYSHNLS